MYYESEFIKLVDRLLFRGIFDDTLNYIIRNIDINKPFITEDDFTDDALPNKLSPLIYVIYNYNYTLTRKNNVFTLIRLFINNGADPNLLSDTLNDNGYIACTPLLCLLEGSRDSELDIIEYLLENGANPFIQAGEDPMEFTDYENIRYLLEKYRYIYRLQSRRRRNLTRRRMKKETAYRNLTMSKLFEGLDVDDPLIREIRRETLRSIYG